MTDHDDNATVDGVYRQELDAWERSRQATRKIVGSPTPEEIQRVREWECSGRGHSFREVMTTGSLIPVLLVCDNCGKKATVTDDD